MPIADLNVVGVLLAGCGGPIGPGDRPGVAEEARSLGVENFGVPIPNDPIRQHFVVHVPAFRYGSAHHTSAWRG